MSRSRTPFVAVATAALMATITAGMTAGAVAQDYASRQTVAAGAAPRLISLPRGTSFAVDLPADAREVIVSNPAVAEANVHSPRRITVIGIAPGETDAVFMDAAGRSILTLRVRVDAGVTALQDTLSRVAPGAQVHAEAVNDSIILTGLVTSAAQSAQVAQVARAFVSTPEKVLNMLTIAGSDQVTLKVRIIEVQRNAIKQLGFDTKAVLGQIGDTQFLLSQAASFAVNGSLLGGISAGASIDTTQNYQMERPCGGAFLPDALCPFVVDGPEDSPNWDTAQPGTGPGSDGLNKGDATIKAFERVGLVRTLAEPNLTSVNGESASFLAGGEFPVPTGRDRDGNATIEFKPYGVSLGFRPIVLSEGRISLQISAEVSELTQTGGITLGAGTPTAVSVAGLNVRRVQNTVEIPSGGSMMIAGLLQESTRQAIDSLPGLGGLPVLGQLFRSRDYLSGETELVVIVEPYIVSPTSPNRLQTPADGLRIPTDAQTIFFGQLNQAYGSPAPTTSPSAGWQGPVGYVIE
ncbi:pilus assembly protein CpaC [Brevundimonas sp. LM2]|uniref:type II and III secretion system protein family protein n=1 Tax=Brevundimonas sp. LM2 TaxID=1938605 RepID=UPI000983AB6F|nr:type II and III secretion system protein family protein [Brevundimonas sp. LM2]AQR60768.1 pilus assembly protein CpaC [Brevundimonas sp. LM2]